MNSGHRDFPTRYRASSSPGTFPPGIHRAGDAAQGAPTATPVGGVVRRTGEGSSLYARHIAGGTADLPECRAAHCRRRLMGHPRVVVPGMAQKPADWRRFVVPAAGTPRQHLWPPDAAPALAARRARPPHPDARAAGPRPPPQRPGRRQARRAPARRRQGTRWEGGHRGRGGGGRHRARRRPHPAADHPPAVTVGAGRTPHGARREQRASRAARRSGIGRACRFALTMPVKPNASASLDARITVRSPVSRGCPARRRYSRRRRTGVKAAMPAGVLGKRRAWICVIHVAA